MIRAEFIQRNHGRALKLEGRLVGAWAVQLKSLLSRHFVLHGFLVDVSEVTKVVGEQLLIWLRELRAKFVAETCYARDVCEKLQLDLQGKETLTGLSRQRIELLPSYPPYRARAISPPNRPGAAPLQMSVHCHLTRIPIRKIECTRQYPD